MSYLILIAALIAMAGFISSIVIRYSSNAKKLVKNTCLLFRKLFAAYFRKKRLKKMNAQIVDVVDMLAGCVKSGLNMQQAFDMISHEGPDPIREEFESAVGRLKLGISFDEVLEHLKKQIPLEDIDIVVEAILVLKSTGGNIIETFGLISETIRERQKVSSRIKTLTMQGLSQAAVLFCLPPILCLGLYIVAPWYIVPLFTTSLGLGLTLIALIMQILGGLCLKKIVTIKI